MHVTKEEIARAKEMDLLTYLVNYEPTNLVKESNNSYCTRNHDSLKISNGLWYWFSQGIGGKTALDYLIKVEGYTFPQAVAKINGRTVDRPPVFYKNKKETPFRLPALADKPARAYQYLVGRGINPGLVRWCIDNNLIFETDVYSNVVFAGYDESGRLRYANLRGTRSTYKGEVSGSDKKYSFKICMVTYPQCLHVFESAIDLLSYITIRITKGEDWKTDAYLSLGGVSAKYKMLPVPLKYYLDNNNDISHITLHMDNDSTGRQASEDLYDKLSKKYTVSSEIPTFGKDINEQLMETIRRTKENFER